MMEIKVGCMLDEYSPISSCISVEWMFDKWWGS